MLRERSRVDIIDNSGAQQVMIFAVDGKNGRRAVGVGDIIKGSVKKASSGGKVKKGDKVSILITGTKRKIHRKDGSSIKLSQNFAVVVNASKDLIGTRVFAPVLREVKELGFNKVASLAPELI